MSGDRFELDEARAVLERTPGVLRALLVGLPDTWLDADEGEGSFSPRDVVAHLCDGERLDWIPRARIILEEGPRRVFEPFDRVAFREWSADLSIVRLVEEFADLRTSNVAQLIAMKLGPEALAREGSHPTFGRVTLGQLLATWVAHDLDHLAQIGRVMARRYTPDVGPWRAFLPILTRVMLNYEIKSVLRDRAEVERRLKALGAEFLLVLRQRDTFYGVAEHWLKLREHDDGELELISYQRPTDTVDARPSEYDVAVIHDVELWRSLLGRVLPVEVVVQKERTLWMFEHTRVHLDRVEDLGDYIELETAVTDIGPEAARAECEGLIEALGLDRSEFLSVPYRDLLA